jgi:hypothetical protein
LIIEDDGKWVGLFLKALSPSDSKLIVLHPGITYGGKIHQGSLRGERIIDALKIIRQHYCHTEVRNLTIYKILLICFC